MVEEGKIKRVVEFYSGIGGMHYGLKKCGIPFKVVAAIDINTTANTIYAHNFPDTPLFQNNIQAISIQQLDGFDADLWTMSPPCQPFTHKGLKLGAEDRRCDSLMELLRKLSMMSKPPRHIFVENVVGFETSTVHEDLLASLGGMGYRYQEYILSPLQFGIPNTRPRYYCLATLNNTRISTNSSIIHKTNKDCVEDISKIEEFIERDVNDSSLTLDCDNVNRFASSIDVVCSSSRRSACFTKSYGIYRTGCGSYFTSNENEIEGNRVLPSALETIRIRLLSPREVANLMCFPKDFNWPDKTTHKQVYRTLGNSVNVLVVSKLIKEILTGYSE